MRVHQALNKTSQKFHSILCILYSRENRVLGFLCCFSVLTVHFSQRKVDFSTNRKFEMEYNKGTKYFVEF